jgi:transcriptional regulator with XRE-family HTH domain
MVKRIQVGTEVVASDDAITSPLNVEHSLGGNVVEFPLGNSVRRDSESVSERLLRAQMPKNTIKGSAGSVTHIRDGIHRQLIGRNRQLIEESEGGADNKQMVDTPKPEHYSTFAQWLEAMRKSRKIPKSEIAKLANVKPQAVTKWFKGGDVKPAALTLISNWSGIEYSKLRMLLEGQPVSEGKKKGLPADTPTLRRLVYKLRSLEDDENSMHVMESLADTLLAQHTDKNKKKPG